MNGGSTFKHVLTLVNNYRYKVNMEEDILFI